MKFNISQKVQEAGMILGALGVIGFIGIIWLMIYGNLSGNLGFPQVGLTVVNESESTTGISIAHANITGYTVNGTTYNSASGYTLTTVWGDHNQSNGTQSAILNLPSGYNITIPLVNVTLSSLGVLTNATTFEYPNLSVSYTEVYRGTSEQEAEEVIGNITGGFGTFFGFSNTFFTIAAIVLLIFMLLGLLALVWTIVQMQSSKENKSKFSEY